MNVGALRRRIRRTIERVGETYLASGVARPAVFAVLPRGRASTFVPDGEVSGLPRPILTAYVPHDDLTAPSAAVVWRSRTMMVRAAVDVRVAGETVARVLVAA